MKYRDTMTVSSKPVRPFKHIVIDYPLGYELRVQDVPVGGFYIREETWKGQIKAILLEGVEIEPEHRRKGIGRALVRQLLERGDIIIGSITEDECKPFWKKMNAVFRPLPLEYFAEKYLPSITTKEPQFFYITKNAKAREMAEQLAVEVPLLMKKEKETGSYKD